MRIVLDTNIFISSIVFKGICREVFNEVIENDQCFISPFILNELKNKLQSKFLITTSGVLDLENDILRVFILQNPHTDFPSICRDNYDNNILQIAESVNADYIITGDKDLLILQKYKQSKIISPSEYLQILLK